MLTDILVPLDGSELAERALPFAAELAHATGAALGLVRATQSHHPALFGQPADPAQLDAYLHARARRLAATGLRVDTEVLPGHPPEALLNEIRRRRPGLVVMTPHGHSTLHYALLPGVADQVAAAALAPVILVPHSFAPRAMPPRLVGTRLLLPLDSSHFAEAVVPMAVQLARALNATLVLLRTVAPTYAPPYTSPFSSSPYDSAQIAMLAWDPEAETVAARAYLTRLADRLAQTAPDVGVSVMVRLGWLAEEIHDLDAATIPGVEPPVGLVAMATHGRNGLRRALLGSMADEVFRCDHLPMLLVHPHQADLNAELAA